MDKKYCKDLIEELGKFLIKNKNMYSQELSTELKKEYGEGYIGLSNDKLEIRICIKKKNK